MNEVPSALKESTAPDAEPALHLGIRLPTPDLSPWPWQATMLTALNCQLLVSFFWFQFVINLCTFSHIGRHFWYYVEEPTPFGRSIPELFFAVSIALSGFAFAAVIGGTIKTPRLWKRLVPIVIFSTVTIGFSSIILNYRHVSYAQSLWLREEGLNDYNRNLVTHHDEEDWIRTHWLDQDLKRLAQMDATISAYEKKYDLPPAIAYPLEHPEVPR
jgi:hypothetical protein